MDALIPHCAVCELKGRKYISVPLQQHQASSHTGGAALTALKIHSRSVPKLLVSLDVWIEAGTLGRSDPKTAAVLGSMFAAQHRYQADKFLEDLPAVNWPESI